MELDTPGRNLSLKIKSRAQQITKHIMCIMFAGLCSLSLNIWNVLI